MGDLFPAFSGIEDGLSILHCLFLKKRLCHIINMPKGHILEGLPLPPTELYLFPNIIYNVFMIWLKLKKLPPGICQGVNTPTFPPPENTIEGNISKYKCGVNLPVY